MRGSRGGEDALRMVMASKVVAGFKPSRHGFHFNNAFAGDAVLNLPVPGLGEIPIGSARRGMCGGMVFAVMDFFYRGLAVPADTEAPRAGTPLFRYIARRLLDSFNGPRGVLKYYTWMSLPDRPFALRRPKSIVWHTVNDEWPGIRRELDRGRLCPLGLIKVKSIDPFKLGENHQVLAYGYELDESTGDLELSVYDPNHHDDDDVTLALNVAGCDEISYTVDAKARGFFRTRYRPRNPIFALSTLV